MRCKGNAFSPVAQGFPLIFQHFIAFAAYWYFFLDFCFCFSDNMCYFVSNLSAIT